LSARKREGTFEAVLSEEPRTILFAEKLRDGRIALGTRTLNRDGEWQPGELHLLEPATYLDFASWLAPFVEQGWLDTVRGRREDPLRTAAELYGEGPHAVRRLAADMLDELPASLLCRAFTLLANSIGPESRERLVARLNRTGNLSEDARIRRQLADEKSAFAYVVAAAALFDAIARGTVDAG
jgi:hypothetical protein